MGGGDRERFADRAHGQGEGDLGPSRHRLRRGVHAGSPRPDRHDALRDVDGKSPLGVRYDRCRGCQRPGDGHQAAGHGTAVGAEHPPAQDVGVRAAAGQKRRQHDGSELPRAAVDPDLQGCRRKRRRMDVQHGPSSALSAPNRPGWGGRRTNARGGGLLTCGSARRVRVFPPLRRLAAIGSDGLARSQPNGRALPAYSGGTVWDLHPTSLVSHGNASIGPSIALIAGPHRVCVEYGVCVSMSSAAWWLSDREDP